MKSLADYVLGRPFTSTRKDFEEVTHRLVADPMPVLERGVRLRDGVVLAADVYLPLEWDRPAPAIVLGTPYDKGNPVLFEPEARFYQRNGYAVVVFDVRGRGKSEGEWRAFTNDARDSYDIIEWAAAQPWCTGAVGTTGISYGGWFQWAAASQHPPHLRCMISTAAGGRWMQEIPYTYGVFQLYFVHWVFRTRNRIFDAADQVSLDDRLMTLPVGAMLDGLADDSPTWRDLMEHDTLDDFWRELRFEDQFAAIDVPCLHVAGWYDVEDILGAFHFYEKMIEHSPARQLQWLMVGPWTHLNTRFPAASYGGMHFGPDALVPMDQIHLRFFDHWLKGLDTGLLEEPRVKLFETGAHTWRTAGRWPLAHRTEDLYLTAEGSLDGAVPKAGTRSYRYDPDLPVRTPIDFTRTPLEPRSLDYASVEGRADVVVYDSAVLTEPVTLSGWPRLELHAASDCDDTDWHVRLTDVQPDGRSIKVASGCLRACCRESLSDPKPLTPGEVCRFSIELSPVTHTVLPGHRIRLTVTSSDFPWFARSLNRFGPIATLTGPQTATNSIHHGAAAPSRVILPVARGSTHSCFSAAPGRMPSADDEGSDGGTAAGD